MYVLPNDETEHNQQKNDDNQQKCLHACYFIMIYIKSKQKIWMKNSLRLLFFENDLKLNKTGNRDWKLWKKNG